MAGPIRALTPLIEALGVSKVEYAKEFLKAKGEKATDDGAHMVARLMLSRRDPPIEDPEVIRWRMVAAIGGPATVGTD